MDAAPSLISAVPSVPIMLDKPRTLRFDFYACMQAELKLADTWGHRPRLSLLGDEGTPVTSLLIYLWAGLLHEEPTLTLEQVGHLVGLRDYATVTAAVTQAWFTSRPPADDAAAANGHGAAPEGAPDPLAPGSGSGALPASSSDSPPTNSGG